MAHENCKIVRQYIYTTETAYEARVSIYRVVSTRISLRVKNVLLDQRDRDTRREARVSPLIRLQVKPISSRFCYFAPDAAAAATFSFSH